MTASPRANRGPKAAAENRRALVRAARDVFAENGFDAPLSSIARAAGVGPGVLYRHFPNRESMILAVFDDNIVAIEEVANRPGTTAENLLDFIVDQIAVSAGFIATIDPTGFDDPRLFEVSRRVVDLIDAKLADQDQRGTLRADLSADDVVMALAMLATVLIKTQLPARRATARRAWGLLMRGLRDPAAVP
ncbi:TetR/AcrR family transcriptional regulator [Nocardia spumae]|uniref:TetR/AcrR family transcriptional regulator n=1 Tax=Nocardia spumae TaxID=2887190 RepID=UPI001D14EDD3|nr:TetR/AcrR family transcriptional regulator [Nocardia spumae]